MLLSLHNGALLWGGVSFSNLRCVGELDLFLTHVKRNFPSFSFSLRFFLPCFFLRVRTTVLWLPGWEALAAFHFQLKLMKNLRREGKAAVWGSWGGNMLCLCKDFLVPVQSFPMKGSRRARGLVEVNSPHDHPLRQLEESPLADSPNAVSSSPHQPVFCFALPCLFLMLISMFIY